MKPKIISQTTGGLKLSTIILLLFIIGAGCKEEEPLETDPAKIILGKWEITHMGNLPGLEPVEYSTGYKEYLPDSVLRQYDYETGEYFYKKYWIDTLLHEGITRSDGFLLTFEYKYFFTKNNNELHLSYNNMIAIHNDFIYKRIK